MNRSKRCSKSSGSRSLTSGDYQALEERRLLASIANELPIAVNLVNNGGFERVGDSTANSAFFRDTNVDNWFAANSANGQTLNIFGFGGVGNVLELDSTGGQFDSVFQDIETRESDEYILSFDFRARSVNSAADADTNSLEVFWDGESLGVFDGVDHFQTVTLRVDGAADEMSRLEFREVNDGSDGRGPLIDNVALVSITDGEITNGSFETTEGDGPLFASGNVLGWFAAATDRADRQLRIESDGASDGQNFLALDSGEVLDRVFQDIDTSDTDQVYLTFDLRGDSELDSDNELRVRWNDEWAGTFQGTERWQTFGLLLDASEVEEVTRLVFRETAGAEGSPGTGSGVQLDNVRVTVVGEFEPFAGLGVLSEVDPADRNNIYSEPPPQTIDTDLEYRASFELENGDEINVLLFADRAPETVNNFVNLVEDGWYDGLTFNRVVNDLAGDPFIAQAGGPFEDNTAGGPGYTFNDEFDPSLSFDRPGLLAKANSGPNTNGSQIFFTYATPTGLNGLHTIFGEIELDDASSFQALNDLTFRDGSTPDVPGDVIRNVTITTQEVVAS